MAVQFGIEPIVPRLPDHRAIFQLLLGQRLRLRLSSFRSLDLAASVQVQSMPGAQNVFIHTKFRSDVVAAETLSGQLLDHATMVGRGSRALPCPFERISAPFSHVNFPCDLNALHTQESKKCANARGRGHTFLVRLVERYPPTAKGDNFTGTLV